MLAYNSSIIVESFAVLYMNAVSNKEVKSILSPFYKGFPNEVLFHLLQ